MISPSHDILSIFHPLVAKWFQDRIGKPTDIQIRAWPYISRGYHVLITAPTGSGKTLTAFLWALNQLITGHSFDVLVDFKTVTLYRKREE